jgi:hypothetical protein
MHQRRSATEQARLSPLIYGHINMLDHYCFAMPETVARANCDPYVIRAIRMLDRTIRSMVPPPDRSEYWGGTLTTEHKFPGRGPRRGWFVKLARE